MDQGRIQRFEIVAELGAGGCGTVYRAYDPQLARAVAIKVLLVQTEPVDHAWPRTVDLRVPSNDDLLAEARVMAQLAHPNVLPVFEVGVHEGAVFLVMELVEGTNLRVWLDTAPSRASVLDVFAQAARGLAAAHARGIVHRDFKPENMLVGADGRVRVADFGISNVAPSQDALLRIAEVSGTPQYMAPELGRAPASPASDVFAFAISLVEALLGWEAGGLRGDALAAALRDADVTPALGALIVASVATDPAARPPLGDLIEALSGHPRGARRRRVLGAVVAACVVGGAGVAYVAWPGDAGPACELDRSLLDAHWTEARRAALVQAHGDAARESIATLDRHAALVVSERQRACQAHARGELSDVQLSVRRGCLDRRAIAIGALAERIAKRKKGPGELAERIYVLSCEDVAAPPSTDLDRYAALELRRVLVGEQPVAARADLLAAVVRDADAAGEVELSIRSELDRGQALGLVEQVAPADLVLKRAHERAMKIQAFDLAANVLVERTLLAWEGNNDLPGARALGGLALELSRRPTVSPRVRAAALESTATLEMLSGNYTKAIEAFDEARRALAVSRGFARTDLAIRVNQTIALLSSGRKPEALVLARETVESTRKRLGADSLDHAEALLNLATALRRTGQVKLSIETGRQALAVFSKTLPPEHSDVVKTRATIAISLAEAGDYETSRSEIRIAVAATETNPTLRGRAGFYLNALAIAEFNLGNHAEAMRIEKRAIDELLSSLGKEHPSTMLALRMYLELATELGQLDEASATLDRIRAGYRSRPPDAKEHAIVLEGTCAAALDLANGRSRAAVLAARTGLAALAELKLDRTEDAAGMYNVLARALVAERDWRGAYTAAETARAIARELELHESRSALFSLPLARAAFELGRRDEARTVLASARQILDHALGEVQGRKTAAALAVTIGK